MKYKIRIKQLNGVNIITVTANTESEAKNKIKLLATDTITGIKEVK